ncbi:MAG: hypothetical protein WBX15_21420 [Thermoanaerobaculia bacterium]
MTIRIRVLFISGAPRSGEYSLTGSAEECQEYIKAVFSDGSVSDPKKFDFCEDDLEIEFE